MSNVLALPLALMAAVIGNNEDWIESVKYVVDDGSDNIDDMPQLDLRGISFEMEVRRKAADHEVILNLSTDNHRLAIGAFPNIGFLLFNVPLDEMQTKMAGSYVADMIARDAEHERKIIEMSLTIVEGITR